MHSLIQDLVQEIHLLDKQLLVKIHLEILNKIINLSNKISVKSILDLEVNLNNNNNSNNLNKAKVVTCSLDSLHLLKVVVFIRLVEILVECLGTHLLQAIFHHLTLKVASINQENDYYT